VRGRILLATHDDSRSIGPVLQEVDEARAVLARSGVHVDVLLVDAGSSDDTVDVARDEAARLGLGLDVHKTARASAVEALREGFTLALDEPDLAFAVTLDAGGQHDARQIPDLVRAHVARSNGVTIGSRWVRGGSSPGTSTLRSAGSRLANLLVRRVCGLRDVADSTTSFRVLHPDVLRLTPPAEALVENSCHFAALTTLAQVEGFAIDEVPIHFRPRYSGVSQLTPADVREFVGGLVATRRVARQRRAELRDDQTAWAKRQRHFAAQEPAADSHFGAMDELVQLSGANRFFGWIVDEFGSAIGPRTLEVGAGLGTVSRMIAERHADAHVTALEPAANCFPLLAETVGGLERIQPLQTTSGALLAAGAAGAFDTVVYVNVLEHIEDDAGELAIAHDLLAPGGHLCLFVPALPALYGPIDHKSGHFRRYTKRALARRVTEAGFVIERVDYMDVAGVVPYWLMFRVLGVENLGGGSNSFYDNVLVPISKAAQRMVPHPPLGKNLILIARS
jgi:2-polyprenyl-3-methyl-5-hydroxy-6-metoxy-1,4-benzoquinol methylase